MNTIFNLIENKASNWIHQEKLKSQSAIGSLVKYIEKENKLREPQQQAIEVYLWLKFVSNNQKLSDIIRAGLLYDEESAREYDNFHTFGNNYTTQFLNQFFQDNNVKNLHKKLVNDPNGEKIKWDEVLEQLLHNYNYPNYLFSLPMGAGKTYLMACFIYLDLYFANLYKKDKRFAHNFIVLAPSASKTAILPSLQTIKNFDPQWILPKNEADKLKRIIQIEILDALSSQRKDKLQGNNPNLEKVNRISQTKNFGMVFITNAEKVVLERYDDISKTAKRMRQYMLQEEEKIKSNELREKLSQVNYLGVILDEVHHTYGKNEEQEEKKLRKAVEVLNQHKNVISVLGLSGTPYIRHKVKIGDDEIKLNQIQDIVYNYYLNQGIGKFLKIPDIKRANIKESLFIHKALDDFFDNFDIDYKNGTKSKVAFYCPSIKILNEKILPVVQDWYKKNRKSKESEIFKFYTNGSKENKQYEIPKDSLAIFNNLDKPYSDKRVILLVAIGKEGWDCKSLTAVVLPRQKTTKNFVLQTSCRCLREVENASKEKALVYLEKDNYETLDNELKENYNLRISDLKFGSQPVIPVKVRKPKLGKLQYRQVKTKYQIVIKKTSDNQLDKFDFKNIQEKYRYDERIIRGRIGRAGIASEIEEKGIKADNFDYSFNDFVYDLAKETMGRFSESDLLEKYKKELGETYKKIQSQFNWIRLNPNLEIREIIKYAASFLMEEIDLKKEIITDNMEIELLEWDIKNPSMALYHASGALAKFMPRITKNNARVYERHPEDLEEDFFGKNTIDPQDISFNYTPYKMDSSFEQNALEEMLKMKELSNLEVYFNGYKDKQLQSFWIQTPKGVYTPDFLILKKDKKKKIEKVLIAETKGKIYYGDEFKQKEHFVKNEFISQNKNFKYTSFVDEAGKNDFVGFLNKLREEIKSL
ncbi:MAG: DEAD/DEAH box helicase family protein [Patescibacteria group bacterium]